ncbi:elongation factor P [Ectocarpus siliculosus]|uniref:Elongation factor P n=1 Tax=Ectocarpus siliculosus TaxID=2880 RepID=D7FX61_ECTSI|nr:elongation factor P [Ectocarpus siliculosus]|eukprot:CBJ26394.1 elongation factor P [Ectocarpus siliculosus]
MDESTGPNRWMDRSERSGLGLLGAEAFVLPSATLRQGSFAQQQQQQRGVTRWTAAAGPRTARGGGVGALSMGSTADFKNGMTIDIDGNPCKILEFLHVKPGKGSAFVRTKVKNLITGNSLEKTFRAGEPVEQAQVDKVDLQYTYKEGDMYYFMDSATYEEVSIAEKVVGDKAGFFLEGMELSATYFKGKVIEVTLPKQMILEVVETDPGEKGNTAQGATKPAKVAAGAIINVPLFITTGEKIRVDIDSKKYMERAKE